MCTKQRRWAYAARKARVPLYMNLCLSVPEFCMILVTVFLEMWILRGPEISLFGFFSEVGRKIQDFSSRICDRGTRIMISTVQRCEERRTIPERSSDDKASNYDSRVSGRGVRSGGGRGSTQHALLMPDGWQRCGGSGGCGSGGCRTQRACRQGVELAQEHRAGAPESQPPSW